MAESTRLSHPTSALKLLRWQARTAAWVAAALVALFGCDTALAQTEIRKTPAAAADGPSRSVVATGIAVTTTGPRTRIAMSVSQPIAAHAYLLADPARLVIDAADLDFQIPLQSPPDAVGLAGRYRYGLIEPGRSRLVVDLLGPARIARTDIKPASPTEPASFNVELEAASQKVFLSSVERLPEPPSVPPSGTKGSTFEDGVEWPKVTDGKPVIMIDPGHGGIDPGALSTGTVREKDVVLAVARQLSAALTATGRYDVHMTRSNDTFIPLDQRIELSRAAGASLFISIHADSIDAAGSPGTQTQSIRGATVYTLSETASNKDAQALADKENAADARAGIDQASGAETEWLKGILIDLMKRETQNFSLEARSLLVQNMRSVMTMAREPARSAAFKVLRQPQSPAVLIELGYMSHNQDVALLQSPEWQKTVAKAIASAVNMYFGKRIAQSP
jgi:N-acetylmuramoyl-L-alanine amidase